MLALTDFSRRLRHYRRHRRERQLYASGWYDLSARSEDAAIFIGGCGRSGTTVFREFLDRHSRIACGPETSMFGMPFSPVNIGPHWEMDIGELAEKAARCRNLVDFAERFYREYLEQEGKPRWADKTPNNVRVITKLLTWFPNGRFIHVIRDGRDVVCSLRHHPRRKNIDGKIVPVSVNNPISVCAKRWLDDTTRGLAYRSHPRCIEVRYETLTADPECELRRVCEFLDEDFEPEMLVPNSGKDKKQGAFLNNPEAGQALSKRSVGRWRRDLAPGERQTFVDIAGELLIALGYAENHDWTDEFESAKEGAGT